MRSPAVIRPDPPPRASGAGLAFAVGCFGLWGLLPLYWKLLRAVPAVEILAHRMVWSLGFVLALLAVRRRWGWLRGLTRRTVAIYLAAATVLAINWGTFIWAVTHDHVVETSLGYFINPLVNIALGAVFLGERPRRAQGIAIALAVLGVAVLTLGYGRPPWVALALAGTFGTYGLLKKLAPLGALEGLTLETALLFLPALAWLGVLEARGVGVFGHADATTHALLALSGVATALPLVLFAAAVRRLTLTALGLVHYLAPTLQVLLGVFAFGEPFTRHHALGFALIWGGLGVYSAEGLWRSRARRRALRGAR